MHNSLFIRDFLKRSNSDPVCLDRRNPHRGVNRDPAARAGEGGPQSRFAGFGGPEFDASGPWRLTADVRPDVAALLVDDLADFLARIGARVAPDAPDSVRFVPAADLGERDCRLTCRPAEVLVEGGGVAGLWAGLAWLEWEMRTRRGPILPVGQFLRRAAWGAQISQGPWGGNYSVPDFSPEYLSDDAFGLYAHYGVNEMMIYGDLLCYVRGGVFPELNCPDAERNLEMLREATVRAERYGVRFCYVVVGPKLRTEHPLFQRLPEVRGSGRAVGEGEGSPNARAPKADIPALGTPHRVWGPHLIVHNLCSSHPLTQAFYRQAFGGLFERVPLLAGVNLILANESMYHCRMHWGGEGLKRPCPVCAQRTTEEVVCELAGVVREAVQGAQPKAYVCAWAYSVDGGWSDQRRLELVRRLPQGVTIFQTLEKDQAYRKGGYVKQIWDYSIDYTGPSDIMIGVSAEARRVGRPLFVKTETGIGLEVFQFPYIPAMQHLADKWQCVRDLAPAGVQQSWLFFGMFGSRAEELGLWAAYGQEGPPNAMTRVWGPQYRRDEFLGRMAVRDFGPRAAREVLAAWAAMSRAVRHLPCLMLGNYYVGPTFLGPCHPLMPRKGEPAPEAFWAYLFYLQEGGETFSRRQVEESKASLVLTELPATARSVGVDWAGDGDGWDIVAGEYSAATDDAYAAWKHLESARGLCATETDRANLHEETLLVELVYRSFRSCRNTVRFLLARRQFEQTRDGAPKAGTPALGTPAEAMAAMRRLAEDEKANALEAAPIYRQAAWLDLAMRIDGVFTPCQEMIAEKVRQLEAFLGEGR